MENLTIYDPQKQSMTTVGFLKSVRHQKRIDLAKTVKGYEETLGQVLSAIIYHTKIKTALNDIDKADIRNMLETSFKHLSLDELRKAFELERYGQLGEKTQHYQLFDPSYISTVLKKYQDWKAKEIKSNYITVRNERDVPTEAEKQVIMREACLRAFKEFKAENHISGVFTHIYDHLHSLNLFPKHDKEFREMIMKKARASTVVGTPKQKRIIEAQLKDMKGKEKISGTLRLLSKRIVLDKYFRTLVASETELADILTN